MNSNGTAKSSTKIASGTGGGPTLANFDFFGSSVASLGDLDGDGVTDLAVGASGDDTGFTNRGAVHVLFLTPVTTTVSLDGSNNLVIDDTNGGTTNDTLTIQSDTTNSRFVISDPNNLLGTSISGASGSGTNTLLIPFASVSGTQILVNTLAGNDSLTVDLSLGNFSKTISYDGGTQTTSDSLTLTGGSTFATVTHSFTSASAGTIAISGNSTISYLGLEPVTDNLSATDRVFTFNGGAETITLTDAAGAAMTIDSTLGESVTFINPTGSVTINAGTGDDTVTITSVDAGFNAALTINGGADSDTVNLNGDVTFASGRSLSVTAESLTTGAGADLVTSGAGTITLTVDDAAIDTTSTLVSASTLTLAPQTTSRPINLGTNTAGQLSLTDAELDRITAGTVQIGDSNSGTITVSAALTHANHLSLTTGAGITVSQAVTMANDKNFSATSTSTSAGIDLASSSSDIAATGSGTISLTAARNIRFLGTGASIVSQNGNVTLLANSSGTTGGDFDGIQLLGTGTTVSTTGSGSVSLTGIGGSGGGANNHGVQITNAATVSSGGLGTVTVNGTGGSGNGNGNVGVQVDQVGSLITSGGGAIFVTGIGGSGSGNFNYGYQSFNSGKIIGGGATGNVTVHGTGGSGTGGSNNGVSLFSISGLAEITSNGGNVQVTGLGGNNAAGGVSIGVVVDSGSQISAGVSGTVTVDGTGGAGTGDGNRGVDVSGSGLVSSSGGAVLVTGVGGSGASSFNPGILIVGTVTSGAGGNVAVTGSSSVSSNGLFVFGTVSSGTTGTVSVTGTGGSGAFGVFVDGAITSGGGNVTVTGSTGLQIVSGGNITTVVNGGAISLIGNAIAIPSGSSVTAGTGVVNLRPFTNGLAIDLGGNDSGTQLGLSDAELDLVTAGTLNIGDANSGPITFSADITRSANTNVSLTTASGNNIAFGAFSLNAGSGGSATLTTSGTGAITTSDNTGTDLTASSVTLNAGSGGVATTTNFLRLSANTVVATTSGNGSLNLVEANSVTLGSAGLSAGTGTISLGAGTFVIGGANRLNDTADVDLTGGATLDLGSNNETIDQLVLTNGSVIGTGTLTGTSLFDVRNGSISAPLTGTVGLTKSTVGTVTLSGTDTYTGATTVNAGRLNVNGSITSNTTVASGATLGGTGTINSANTTTVQSGGRVAPGTSPGILNTGNVSFASGSTFAVELNGTTVGTQYDQLNVTGTVALGNAVLSTALGFTPANGDTFTIINNDDSDAITGTFNGLAEGASLTIDGTPFTISYLGGTNGNDVVLTVGLAETPSFVVTTAADAVNPFDNLTSLREAITFANSNADANTITFAAGINGTEIDLTGGVMLVTSAVTITGNGAANTIVDAQSSSRLFFVDDLGSAIAVSLSGLTLKNGFAVGGFGVTDGKGGAIYSDDLVTLTITNSSVTGNKSDFDGGAIYSLGTLNVTGSTFTGNAADEASASFPREGGAINNQGTATISSSTFTNNYASEDGGAILNNGTLTVTGSTFSLNTTGDDAGAIDNQSGAGLLTITDSSFTQNSAIGTGSAVGGAIRISGGTALITGSTFSQNFATEDSGAIHLDGDTTIRNSTFSANSTDGLGGAIYNHGGNLTIINSTLTLNRANADDSGSETGGGIVTDSGAADQTTIKNTIVAGNLTGSGAGTPSDITGKNLEAASTFNLIGDAASAGGLTHGTNGNLVGVNPLLDVLANNGGPTLTHALLAGSPAINSGSNANVPGDITTDQRGVGFSRFVGTVDIGAFEVADSTPPTVTVNIVDASLNDGDNSSLVTFEFSENVTGFDASDLTPVGGTLSAFTTIDGNSYTVTFTATDGIATTGSVTVGTGYTDAVGNTGTSGSDTVSIDTLNPTVTVNIVDASLNDGDNSSLVTFEFSENVTGFDAGDLTPVGGTLSAFTTIDGDSYTATFTASDGIATTGSVTVGTGYTDAVSNTGTTGSDTVAIDTLNPTADIVDVTPDPRTTSAGTVAVTFTESVTGVDINDFTLTRDGNSVSLSGLTVSGSGASYSVNLSSVTNAVGSYVLTLVASGSGVQDLAGNLLTANASDTWSRVNPTVSLSINNATIAEAAGAAIVTATLNQITDVDVTVSLGFTGSAIKDTDFSASSSTIVITAGNLIGTMTVTATQDGLLEISETVFVDIIGVTNGLESGTQQVVTSIVDDDNAPTITSTATPSIVENTTAMLTVTATDADTPPQTVTFTITGGLDAALFQITSGGALSFLFAPDFENPQDNGGNNFYDVQVTANDGNLGTDVQILVVAVTDADEIVPTVSITAVTPDPRNSAVSTITILFSEAVTGFGLSDLMLTRNSGSNLLTGSQTLNSSDGGVTYTLGNLSGLTTTDGVYLLTLTASGSGIADLASNSLTTGDTEAWTMDATVPTASITAVSPDPRNVPVGSITIVFTEAISGFNLADLTLTRDGGSSLLTGSQTLTTSDNITFTLNNLTTITGPQGAYLLTLTASSSGIVDQANNGLSGNATEAWTMDTTALTVDITDVTPDPRNNSVGTITIVFSKAVSGFALNDLTLTRNSGSNLLTGSQTLTTSDNITWTLGNLSGLTGTAGTYLLSLAASGSGITDAASNALSADASDAWTVDTTAPTADISDVTPDPRNANAGTVTVNFNETVTGVNTADFTLTRNGNPVSLSGLTVGGSGSSYTLGLSSVTTLAGSYVLTLNASGSGIADTATNALAVDASDSFVVDLTAPTADISDVTPDPRNSAVSSITIVFSEAVTGLDVSDLSLTRNGGGNLLTGSQTLASSDGSVTFTLGNLSGLTGAAGTYLLTLTASGSGIADTATNGLSGNASDSWTTDLTAPTADISDVTPDPRNNAVGSITIPFSEAITGFDLADLSLTRDGGSNLLTGSQTLLSSDGGVTFTLGNLTSLTGTQGAYSLTLTASGSSISDSASNALSANASDTWTVNTTAPTATISAVTSPRNSAVNSLTITFSSAVTGFDLADLSLTRDGGSNLLTASQTLSLSDGGVTFTLGNLTTLTGLQGAYSLKLTASGSNIIDSVSNTLLSDVTRTWSLDSTAPGAIVTAVDPDPRSTSVNTLTITFSEPITG